MQVHGVRSKPSVGGPQERLALPRLRDHISRVERNEPNPEAPSMNDDVFNMEIRKFLKRVGVTSQREIEAAVRAAAQDGRLGDKGKVMLKMTLEAPEIGLNHETVDEIPPARSEERRVGQGCVSTCR